ncbi:hypothetical protein CDAR_369511 [Caerostris darwini]|uniref:Uncharacterized protein n=1 Tax=Caerostris darwini TaxID=1538125 RepID=A0AAV4RZQ3_9ARAC|nr:hypothetical protein CDAR_369511 [Caerostris darwini]
MRITHYHLRLQIETDYCFGFLGRAHICVAFVFCFCYLDRKIAIGFLEWKRESSVLLVSQILITVAAIWIGKIAIGFLEWKGENPVLLVSQILITGTGENTC